MQESNDLSIALIGLWGAIGGAFFTLLGTIVTQFVTYVKDKGLAEIAAKEKDKEREFTMRTNKQEALVSLFENCLSAIAVFQHKYQGMDEDLTKEVAEVQTNVAKLFVKFCDPNLDEAYGFFLGTPHLTTASNLRKAILNVLRESSGLSVSVSGESKPPKVEDNGYKFQIYVKDEYILSCFVEKGELMPKVVSMDYKAEDLDSETRRFLLMLNHTSGQIHLNRIIVLSIPIGSNPKVNNKRWEVDFDPRSEGLSITLEQWKEEFSKSLDKINSIN